VGATRPGASFTGREWDPETGLYYYRARYYDPKIGRFVSEDPIGLGGGVNFYGYVANNPVRSRDPLGLWSPGGHDRLFQTAFDGYRDVTLVDINIMSAASRDFDSKTQDEFYSNAHSMRRARQSASDAIKGRDAFVSGRLCRARVRAAEGDRIEALKLLAEAGHALQDMLSPLHTGPDGEPLPWDNEAFAKSLVGFGHSPFEDWGTEDASHLHTLIVLRNMNNMRAAYDFVFTR
jgi:RHS repeat-associated protein